MLQQPLNLLRSAARLLIGEWSRQPLTGKWWAAPFVILLITLAFVPSVLLVDREFPLDVGRDVGRSIEDGIDWVRDNFDWLFSAIKDVLDWFLVGFDEALLWLPWTAFLVIVGLLSWLMVSFRMALFAVGAMALIGVVGLWASAMETISLIIVTVSLSIMIAVPFGIWASQSNRVDALLRPILDTMQTMPSFVYLVPAVVFFGLGNVPAVIATLIFAVPPAVRLTNLGIRELPEETIEAAESFGTTRRQMLLKVKIPLAIPTIMAGINQTTLLAFSMIVIASLVGAEGIGRDLNRALGRLEPGNAALAGIGIVFLAIIVDRLTQALTRRQQESTGR